MPRLMLEQARHNEEGDSAVPKALDALAFASVPGQGSDAAMHHKPILDSHVGKPKTWHAVRRADRRARPHQVEGADLGAQLAVVGRPDFAQRHTRHLGRQQVLTGDDPVESHPLQSREAPWPPAQPACQSMSSSPQLGLHEDGIPFACPERPSLSDR